MPEIRQRTGVRQQYDNETFKNLQIMVYEFLATGFEDVEALIPVDIFRRAGLEVKTVSVTGERLVESAHGVRIESDILFEDANFDDADLLMLPGGLPGATNLRDHEGLCNALLAHAGKGRKVAAICAAPMVLGKLGLLKGRRATCYPGFESHMTGAEYTAELFTIDGNITTGEGPAATFPYAYAILEQFVDKATVDGIREGMRFNHLMAK